MGYVEQSVKGVRSVSLVGRRPKVTGSAGGVEMGRRGSLGSGRVRHGQFFGARSRLENAYRGRSAFDLSSDYGIASEVDAKADGRKSK